MEEDGVRERSRDRVRGRERESCNVMLNSNMQCSHHGNGGSSEAWHGAENVCFGCVFACRSLSASVSVRLCICVKVRHNMLGKTHWRSSAAAEAVQHSRGCKKKKKTFGRSLKLE